MRIISIKEARAQQPRFKRGGNGVVFNAMLECPLLATSGLKRHLGLTSAWGQEADIAVLAIDPHVQGTVIPGFGIPRTALDAPEWPAPER